MATAVNPAPVQIVNADGTIASFGNTPTVIKAYKEVDADYTINPAADHTIRDICGSGSITITLPAAATCPIGQEFVIIDDNTDTNQTHISDGVSDIYLLTDVHTKAIVYNNGTSWVVAI